MPVPIWGNAGTDRINPVVEAGATYTGLDTSLLVERHVPSLAAA
jgi:hypothetical protein